MRRLLMSAVLLASCVTDGPVPDTFMEGEFEGLPAEFQAPVDGPLPPPMTLVAGPLVPGTPFLLSSFGANPGDEVWFVRSPTLGSTCAPFLSDCLDISNPIVLTSVIADSAGVASLLVNIPPSIPVGGTMHFQAGVLGGANGYISNLASATSEGICGDSIVQSNEDCDDGNTDNTDGCTNNCVAGSCGDGMVDFGEACDDGNLINGDGCATSCELDRFNIEVLSAVIAPSPAGSFDPWDVVALPTFENPDVYVEIYRGNQLIGTTVEVGDSLTPVFNSSTVQSVPPGGVITMLAYDADTLFDTFIDEVVITYDDLIDAEGAGVVTFQGEDNLVRTLRVRITATPL